MIKDKSRLDTIKLSDFGLSVKTKQKNTFAWRQKCGTLSYMSPELVREGSSVYVSCSCRESRISPAIDIWAVGVVMAIMLNDCSHPYIEKGQSDRTIKSTILSNQYRLDSIKCSNKALDLMQKLLRLNPSDRIIASEALKHPWFVFNRSFLTNDNKRQIIKHQTTNTFYQPVVHTSKITRASVYLTLKILSIISYCKTTHRHTINKTYSRNDNRMIKIGGIINADVPLKRFNISDKIIQSINDRDGPPSQNSIFLRKGKSVSHNKRDTHTIDSTFRISSKGDSKRYNLRHTSIDNSMNRRDTTRTRKDSINSNMYNKTVSNTFMDRYVSNSSMDRRKRDVKLMPNNNDRHIHTNILINQLTINYNKGGSIG